jgi:hypothetical protein
MTELSEVAQAELKIAKGGEACFWCHRSHVTGETFVIGSSLDDQLGYIGGIFCLEHWLEINDHPKNREVLKMATEKKKDLGIPKLKPFGETKAARIEWDYTHSQIVDKVVIILSAVGTDTQFGNAYICECIIDEQRVNVLFGGSVLCKQIEQMSDELPVQAWVIKPAHYYMLADPSEQ